MAIQPIEQRLDSMTVSADVDKIPTTMPNTPDMENLAAPQDDPQEEPIQVAGLSALSAGFLPR